MRDQDPDSRARGRLRWEEAQGWHCCVGAGRRNGGPDSWSLGRRRVGSGFLGLGEEELGVEVAPSLGLLPSGVTLVGRPRGVAGGALCLFLAGTGLLIGICLLLWCLYRRAARHRPFAHHRLPNDGDEPGEQLSQRTAP